jgi:hypothetical protein
VVPGLLWNSNIFSTSRFISNTLFRILWLFLYRTSFRWDENSLVSKLSYSNYMLDFWTDLLSKGSIMATSWYSCTLLSNSSLVMMKPRSIIKVLTFLGGVKNAMGVWYYIRDSVSRFVASSLTFFGVFFFFVTFFFYLKFYTIFA